MSTGSLPPIAALTEEDKGPVVIVLSYILLVITVLFVGIKLVSTAALKRSFDWDDALLTGATLLGIAQSVVTERSAFPGVGRYQPSLQPDELERYFKLAYTGNILSIIVQTLSKLSAIYLTQRLGSSTTGRKRFPAIYACIVAWALFSIFALAFQCDLPRPWVYQPSQCAGQGALWYAVLILNMVSDLVISFVFTPIVWGLQISRATKLRISSLFGVRIVVVGLTIAQLATLAPALRAEDTTRAMMVPTVFGQFVMAFSILTAATPSLYRFLNELHSGPGFGGMIDRSNYELSSFSGKNSSSRDNKKKSTGYTGSRSRPTFRPDVDHKSYDVTIDESSRQRGTSTDGVSKSSDHGSEDMIIRQTTAWTVTTKDRDSGLGGP